ncbi:hypothetical protein SLS59_000683 [Nothophoma quercina]|uniref:Xaa-Pro dipeptidyl-peptidase C-terminal domain-containing protein n=1 Tax=Nothophoma quercina TaxID=749835 RepID=A0ABR3S2Y5_9PLEO
MASDLDKFMTVNKDDFPYIFIQHKDAPLRTNHTGVLRCNVYLPKDAAPFGDETYPVLATYGPYGKDVPYDIFYRKSWDQLNPAMKSAHSSWETPDPGYWTTRGYIIVRVDELGSGQSPGLLDTMSQEFWWENAVQPNQYGKPGREARKWGLDTLEGDLDEEMLKRNRRNQMLDTAAHRYRDEEYYKSRDFDASDIEVPLLSVANWGDCGVDDPEHELAFPLRGEVDWPIPDTEYTKFFLTAGGGLSEKADPELSSFTYDALNGDPLTFKYKANKVFEITGHIVAHFNVSLAAKDDQVPSDINLFVTLRKLDKSGQEVFFTGTMGDPVSIVKGWQRVSLRKTDESNPLHREYLPYRNYYSSDVQEVKAGEVYSVDVEVWPTNVVLEEGETLVFEIAGHDTQGVGKFSHDHPEDRPAHVFDGLNTVHVGGESSWLLLPMIPDRSS